MNLILLYSAIGVQLIALVYALYLLKRYRGSAGGWAFMLCAFIGMLTWRVAIALDSDHGEILNGAVSFFVSLSLLLALVAFSQSAQVRTSAEAARDDLLFLEQAARRDAEQANEVKNEFVSMLSHDLRTPIQSILNWSMVLKKTRTEPEVVRIASSIERSARSQARLIDDLLEQTKWRAGTLTLQTTKMSLVRAVDLAIENVQLDADAKNVNVRLVGDSAALLVLGDLERLRQVFCNLLVNAIKFSEKGAEVLVAIEESDDSARVAVIDFGRGIAGDLLPHVFVPFSRGDPSETGDPRGLGLGLAIVARIVELHGGRVEAHSDGPGKGSRFSVLLPLLDARPQANAESSLA